MITLVMMVGAGREAEAETALRSAEPFYDRACFLLWGGSKEWADRRGAWHRHEGTSFGDARSTALAFAQSTYADVILMVDTDEQIAGDPEAFRVECADMGFCEAHYIERQDRLYAQPRVFSRDAPTHFVGSTHEFYAHGASGVMQSVRFWEPSKTPDQLRAKAERDIRILSSDKPSWRRDHYLAESYLLHGDKQSAEHCFRGALAWAKVDDEPFGAWSAFRLALTCLDGAPWHQSKALHLGLALDNSSPELLSLAARVANKRQLHEEALAYACQSIACGHVEGLRRSGNAYPARPEVHFKAWPTRFDMPYLEAAIACAHLGRDQDQRDFLQKTQVAKRLRLRHTLYLQTPSGEPEAMADTDPVPPMIAGE